MTVIISESYNSCQARKKEQEMAQKNVATNSPGSLTIHKAMTVLRAFTPESPTMSVRQVAEKIGVPKSTVHRLLSVLQEENLIELDPDTGYYQLGYELVVLAGCLLRSRDVRNIALPYMQDLGERWHETVCLDVMRGIDIIITEQIPGQHFLHTGGTFAARQPAHCTSTGKVLLAFAGQKYVESHLPETLAAFTPNTITSREKLLIELARIRSQGYSIANGEYGDMVTACAAPIHHRTGEVIAAMSISGLTLRMEGHGIEAIVNDLISVTDKISSNLGHIRG
jgi:DNA-binding IclR family transcriptional regulator